MRSKQSQPNPNSPENVLGVWLERMSEQFNQYGLGGDEYDNNCLSLLAEVLAFANKHGKIVEMLQWLSTKEADKFLNQKKYQPAGNMLSNKIFYAQEFLSDAMLDLHPSSREEYSEVEAKVVEWANKHTDYCRYAITLN